MSDVALSSLPPRQQRFAEEYLNSFNGLQSALKAGYSPKGAEVQAHRLLRDERVASVIDKGRAKAAAKLLMGAEEVTRTYTKLARADVRKLFNEDGKLKAIHELDDDTAACIASFEIRTETTKGKRGTPPQTYQIARVKLWDKLAALQGLGRIHALFRDKVEVNATLTLESLVLGAMDRGKQLEAPQPATKPTEAPLTIEGKVEEPESLTVKD